MWLYRALDFVFPTSFAAKLVFVALCGMALPPLLVGVYLFAEGGLRSLAQPSYVLFLISSGMATALVIPSLIALLEPLSHMGKALSGMEKRREFTPLPEEYRDYLGQMMMTSNAIARAMGARVDPRFSKGHLNPLTGVLDQNGFELALMRQGCGTLVMLHIDNMQGIRSEHGNALADALLAQAGQAIRTELRDGDLVGHVGDAEFGLWLKGAGRVVSRHVAERVCAAVKQATVHELPGVTLSAGAAVRGEKETLKDLSDRADTAWREASARGDWVEVARGVG